MEVKNLTILGGCAAAAIAGAYVLWGPSESEKFKNWKNVAIPGLQNSGNSCFLNALLQSWASCSSVIQWLDDFVAEFRGNRQEIMLVDVLLKILNDLNNNGKNRSSVLCATEVIDALRRRRWVISSEQQDAHELFHVITQTIDEEVGETPVKHSILNPLLLRDCGLDVSEGANRSRTSLPCISARRQCFPFRGLVASQLTCKACRHKFPVKYDSFKSLLLPIPQHVVGRLSLYTCLKEFCTEIIKNVECENCNKSYMHETDEQPKMKTKTTFIKQTSIGKLPSCLCIHLQRTSWLSNSVPSKCYDHVSFPELLDLRDFVFHKQMPSRDVDVALRVKRLLGGNRQPDAKLSSVSASVDSNPQSDVSQPAQCKPVLNIACDAVQTHDSLDRGDSHTNDRTLHKGSGSQLDAHVDRSEMDRGDTATLTSLPSYIPTVTNAQYRLQAVVVHIGDMFSGHYVTFRRFLNNWFYTSDVTVYKVSAKEVMACDAYLLFYERIL